MGADFVLIGVCIACAGLYPTIHGVYLLRRNEVTPRDIVRWRERAGKQGFSVPWNMSLDIVVAFVRAWRIQDAFRNLGAGIAILVFGVIVALFNAFKLTSKGALINMLYQYLGVVLYSAVVLAVYLGISRLSRRQGMRGQPPNQRPLRDYRYPLAPALCVVLLLGYVALLVDVVARLARGFDRAALAQLLTLPEMWNLLIGLVAIFVAVAGTEVVVRRIASSPPIPFPPAYGWERVADAALRLQAIAPCYAATSAVIFMVAIIFTDASSLSSPIAQAGMAGWYNLYFILVVLVALVIMLLTLFKAPRPAATPASANPGTTTQPQQQQ